MWSRVCLAQLTAPVGENRSGGCSSHGRHTGAPDTQPPALEPGGTTRKYFSSSPAADMAAAAVSRTLLSATRRRLWGFSRRLPHGDAAAQVSLAPARRGRSRCAPGAPGPPGPPTPTPGRGTGRGCKRGRSRRQGRGRGRGRGRLPGSRKEQGLTTKVLVFADWGRLVRNAASFFLLETSSSSVSLKVS